MAYEKYTWVDGELITAEKLNHMEDGIAEGGDTGYTCTETTERLFNETVTTAESEDGCSAHLAYSEPITADELTVVFNGTEYVCPKIVDESIMFYGGYDLNTGMPDFTNYPFVIGGTGGMNSIATESPMTVTVSASVTSSTVETTECFEKAVKTVADRGYECSETTTPLFDEVVTTVQDGEDVVAQLAYSEPITADKIIVTFDGTQYVCPKIIVDALGTGMAFYGGMSETGDLDFTNYPFVIISRPDANVIATPTANTYHINVVVVGIEATNISPCFASAVKKSSDSSVKIKTATLSADNVSVDGLTTVLLRPLPDDYGATVGVIGIFPLETEDVYATGFDCSGNRDRFFLNYTNKQSSPVTIDRVECRFTYISESGDK